MTQAGAALNEVDQLPDFRECDGCGWMIHTERCPDCPAFISVGHMAGCQWPEAYHEHLDPHRALPVEDIGGLYLTIPSPDGVIEKDGATLAYRMGERDDGLFDVRIMFDREPGKAAYDSFMFWECRRPWEQTGADAHGFLWELPEDRVITGLRPGLYKVSLWLMNN